MTKSPHRALPAAAALLLVLLGTERARPSENAHHAPIDIGSRLELMVDDHLVDRLKGDIHFQFHAPVPREVVFETDRPWEGNASGYFTLFQDGDLYRMYYRGLHYETEPHPVPRNNQSVCYAESTDGIHWTRPPLSQIEFNDSNDNNIIKVDAGSHNFTPFKDLNPDCPPDELYKATGRRKPAPKGLYGLVSADAIHWRLLPGDEPLITQGDFDSQNVVFWDTVRGEYREYHRTLRRHLRDIQTSTSDDFSEWPDPRFLEYGKKAPPEELYTNGVLPYPRAPHLFVGFPTRFSTVEGGQTEPLFMTSRDGRNFKRWEIPIIPRSAPMDREGNRTNYAAWGLLRLPGTPGEISLYATEGSLKGNSVRLRRFTYRLDGFISLRTPGKRKGIILTKPLTFDGENLFLNLRTGGAGRVRVEVRTANNGPIEGFRLRECQAISGDHVSRMITWKSGAKLGDLAGKPVRLRIQLVDTDLFSMRFR